MAKKSKKLPKLSLSRETVRRLTTTELGAIAGGLQNEWPTVCPKTDSCGGATCCCSY